MLLTTEPGAARRHVSVITLKIWPGDFRVEVKPSAERSTHLEGLLRFRYSLLCALAAFAQCYTSSLDSR